MEDRRRQYLIYWPYQPKHIPSLQSISYFPAAGISGWFPVDRPNVGWVVPSDDDRHGNHRIRVVGGLELSLKFGHHDDLERVDHAARGVGWAPDFDVAHRDWAEAGTVAMIIFYIIYIYIFFLNWFCYGVYVG